MKNPWQNKSFLRKQLQEILDAAQKDHPQAAKVRVVQPDPVVAKLKEEMNIPEDDVEVEVECKPVEMIQVEFTINEDGTTTFKGA